MRTLRVVRGGPLTTVQDLGRRGLAQFGVPRSGACDEPALRAANRLVGNPEGYAALEVTLVGAAVRPEQDVVFAVTGAAVGVVVDGEPAGRNVPVTVAAGRVVKLGVARHGVRSYLAVAGGINVPPVLGSRSTDTLSGLGPPRVRDGDVLPLGEPVAPPDFTSMSPRPVSPRDAVVRVRLGPRHAWFTARSIDTFLASRYTVSPASNRVGVRLAGPPLARAVPGELPSEGVVLGAVQVPSEGQPLVFLADHPSTGGYPVIAVVERVDLPVVAQARPGTQLRFTTV